MTRARSYRARRPLRVSLYTVRLDARGYVVPGREAGAALFRAFRRLPSWRAYRAATVEAWRRGRPVLVTGEGVAAPAFVEVWR